MTPVRLLIADDHALVVEGLRKLLEPRHRVVGVARNGAAVLKLVARQPADCLLLDLSMPQGNGLDLIGPIRAQAPELKILIVTMFVDRCWPRRRCRPAPTASCRRTRGLPSWRRRSSR